MLFTTCKWSCSSLTIAIIKVMVLLIQKLRDFRTVTLRKSRGLKSRGIFGEWLFKNPAVSKNRGIFGRWHSENPAVSQNRGIFGRRQSENPAVPKNRGIFGRQLSENPAVSKNRGIFGVLASKYPVIPWEDCVIFGVQHAIVCPLIEPATTFNSPNWLLLNSGTVRYFNAQRAPF
jgi:hypothetical protein